MSTQNNFELRPIKDLVHHHFFIPDYQRGYKWDVQQVLDLLEDIEEFEFNEKESNFYCLQPLAVSLLTKEKIEEREIEIKKVPIPQRIHEVIDGQQRLTTVHIILSMISDSIYTIEYETRGKSSELLENIKSFFDTYSILFEEKKLTELINIQWKSFIADKSDYDNIDYYHFFTAFLTVKAWFASKEVDKTEFANKLLYQTEFIWYNETNEQNAKRVFRNLNSGKIPLTNAELIKALFVNSLKDANKNIQQLKQSAFAVEWDMIETTLQDNDFWYFISNTNTNKYATRIDFLFELINSKPEGNKDKIYTYHQYAELAKKQNSQLMLEAWQVVKSLFLKLREWYEDNELYHLVGYLAASWNKLEPLVGIKEIEENSKEKGKAAFKTYLIGKIRERVFSNREPNKVFDLKSINYNDNAALLNRILLLHNIETYQKDIVGFRFPFYDFKYRKKDGKLKKNTWSLEHIHAQQSDKVKTVKELKDWMGEDDMEKMVENEDEALKETLKKRVEELNKSYNHPKKMKETDEVTDIQKEILKDIETKLKIHEVWNMALLEKDMNSSLGKKPFKKKREELIAKSIKNEAFIPLCTRNAFLKVYTKDLTQISYWSYQDRKDYLDDIENKLGKYIAINLPKPTK